VPQASKLGTYRGRRVALLVRSRHPERGSVESADDVELTGVGLLLIGGGADVIREGLDAGVIDELAIIVAPVILGGGKALFDGFTKSLDLEHIGVRQTQWATLIEYRLKK